MPSYYSKELSGTQSESSPISHPTEKGQEVWSGHEMSETAVCVNRQARSLGPSARHHGGRQGRRDGDQGH